MARMINCKFYQWINHFLLSPFWYVPWNSSEQLTQWDSPMRVKLSVWKPCVKTLLIELLPWALLINQSKWDLWLFEGERIVLQIPTGKTMIPPNFQAGFPLKYIYIYMLSSWKCFLFISWGWDISNQRSQDLAEPWHRAQCILFLLVATQVENHISNKWGHLSAYSPAENWPTYPVNSVHNVGQTVRSLFKISDNFYYLKCEGFLWEFWSWATRATILANVCFENVSELFQISHKHGTFLFLSE